MNRATPFFNQIARNVFVVKYNLQLAPGSVDKLNDIIQETDVDPTNREELQEVFELIVKGTQGAGSGLDGPLKITPHIIQETYEKLRAQGDDTGDTDDIGVSQYFRVIDALAMPLYHWSEESNQFELSARPPSVIAPPAAKAQYLRDRYNIIKQVILRNEHFSPPAIPGQDRSTYMKITAISDLLGRQGRNFLLLGYLSRLPGGEFSLEDLDGTVQLDLSEATPESGLFTEGSFVLVDGVYKENNIFKVYEMGHPPSEPRDLSCKLFGHLDFLGVGALSAEEEHRFRELEQSPAHATSFVVLSDVHLDDERTLTALQTMFSTYDSLPNNQKPFVFIFCGNFRSRPFLYDGQSTDDYAGLFARFAEILDAFTQLKTHSRFVFVPGPNDPYPGAQIPRAPLPAKVTRAITRALPPGHAIFATNPCRIRYFTQEIVVFREDTMSQMMRNAIRVGTEANVTDIRTGLVQTLLDQAHLAPLPLMVRPVLWDYDHALRLYPFPTTLILADKFDAYKLVYQKTLVFNPGSFSKRHFAWSTYYPGMADPNERVEESELPE